MNYTKICYLLYNKCLYSKEQWDGFYPLPKMVIILRYTTITNICYINILQVIKKGPLTWWVQILSNTFEKASQSEPFNLNLQFTLEIFIHHISCYPKETAIAQPDQTSDLSRPILCTPQSERKQLSPEEAAYTHHFMQHHEPQLLILYNSTVFLLVP